MSGLGFYAGAGELDYPALETLRWTGWTAAMLPFAAGVLVVPGALAGLWFAVRSPRARSESAFGVITVLLLVAAPLEGGLIASGDAHRPLERYAFYVLPLVFTAFFVYVERGAPRRLVHAGVALALGGLALAVPFAGLATEPFSFDSPTVSAVSALGRWTAPGDAAALFATGGLLAALVAAAVPVRRFGLALASVSVVLAFAIGVAAYSGDRRMTHRTLHAVAPAAPDWLDRSGVARADLLVLPGASLHRGWLLESWNRNVDRVFHLDGVDSDPLPFTTVGIGRSGVLHEVSGKAMTSSYVVVDESASDVELVGDKLAEPTPGLSLYRVESPVRVKSLAEGVYPDRWARAAVIYSVAADSAGSYEVGLSLPRGWAPRSVDLEVGPVRRRVELAADAPLRVDIPVSGGQVPPLAIRIDRADLVDAATPHPRLVGARLTTLRFVPSTGSRNL